MTKCLLLIISVLTSQAALAKVYVSPFPSSVPEISIRNTHLLAKSQGSILRGMAPLSAGDIQQLADFGVTDILVFRNQVEGEEGMLSREEVLQADPQKRIEHVTVIPFQWKEVREWTTPCEQTIQALRLMQTTLSQKGKGLFFHCTLGEDRTGFLAGMYRILFEKWSPEEAFQSEMCSHGYAEGDPRKAPEISNIVHANITPTFLKMVALYEAGLISAKNLDESACKANPISIRQLNQFHCHPQKINQPLP